MAEYDKQIVAPLLRRRAMLEETHADLAKIAEVDHDLRMAGYPVDEKSPLVGNPDVDQEKPGVPRAERELTVTDDDLTEREARHVLPKERSARPGTDTAAVPDRSKGAREMMAAEVLSDREYRKAEKDAEKAKHEEDVRAGRVQPDRDDAESPARSEDGTHDLASPADTKDGEPVRSEDGTRDLASPKDESDGKPARSEDGTKDTSKDKPAAKDEGKPKTESKADGKDDAAKPAAKAEVEVKTKVESGGSSKTTSDKTATAKPEPKDADGKGKAAKTSYNDQAK